MVAFEIETFPLEHPVFYLKSHTIDAFQINLYSKS